MDWLFEADRDAERRFPWISIPGVASIVYWVKSLFGTTLVRLAFASYACSRLLLFIACLWLDQKVLDDVTKYRILFSHQLFRNP
jgi:hypothetical protein